ncbi:response regulator [Fulvivirga maritima]|uniref:response regulator n=1 Tax=Fulvivirga maritima TaxID=2904247 RepID=UPI001F4703E8|nr:response regulator [Fulvivirga maritima]UII25801.1 response regulator [Fulvivirga maritima]
MKQLNCVMLVDDNPDDNFFHKRILKKSGKVKSIVALESGTEALDYLRDSLDSGNPSPDLLFLDINMPGMNGWEFLEEYKKLDPENQAKVVMIMLTTSRRLEDKETAMNIHSDIGFLSKPLTREMFDDLLSKHFNDQ